MFARCDIRDKMSKCSYAGACRSHLPHYENKQLWCRPSASSVAYPRPDNLIYSITERALNGMLSLEPVLVMSIGNQEFGIPRKYQYQIGIWFLCLIFLGIFLVFYRNLEYDFVKSWFNIGIFRQKKNRFGIWFLWLPFHWYRFGFGLSFS